MSKKQQLRGGTSQRNPLEGLKEVGRGGMVLVEDVPEVSEEAQVTDQSDSFDKAVQEAMEKDRVLAPKVDKHMMLVVLPGLKRVETRVQDVGSVCLQQVAGMNEVTKESETYGDRRKRLADLKDSYLKGGIDIKVGVETIRVPAKAVRRAACLAELKFEIGSATSRDELVDSIQGLVTRGYLKADDEKGLIGVWRNGHALVKGDSDHGDFILEDERELASVVEETVSRINTAFKEQEEASIEKMRKDSEITFDQLMDGQAGRCFAEVPFEIQTFDDGTKMKLYPVAFTVAGDGRGPEKGWISVIEAHGQGARSVLEIRESGLMLMVKSLRNSRPPNPAMSPDAVKKVRRLWYLLKRAQVAEAERVVRETREKVSAVEREEADKMLAELTPIKEGYKKMVAQSPDPQSLERALDDGKPDLARQGVFYAEYPGAWRNKDDGTVAVPKGKLFFLAEQKVVDDKLTLRIVDAPPWARDFFGEECMKPTAVDNLPYPLRAVMNALYNRTRVRPV